MVRFVALEHVFRMTFVMKQNKPSDPADVGLFRAVTEMLEAEDLPHLVEQSGLRLHATSQRSYSRPR